MLARMAFERAPLADLPWTQGAHPLERKKAWPSRGVTLLEFAPGFRDPNVCVNGHAIYVLEGELAFELDGGVVERIAAGDACFLDPGTGHQAFNPGDVAVRVLVLAL
jgi:quercetin dioxygenase-like cupin family protein